MLQVLIDADNLPAGLLGRLLRAVPTDEVAVVVAGSSRALAAVAWPAAAAVHCVSGPERADAVLRQAYHPGRSPLLLASGDKDFAELVRHHEGAVLVVADRPAKALRGLAPVLDPGKEGVAALRAWFDTHLDRPWADP